MEYVYARELLLTPTQIRIIWMLLSTCGTPMRTFSKMGISSEKLGIHASNHGRRPTSGICPHLPAGRR